MQATVVDARPPSAQRRSYAACFAAFIAEARAMPSGTVIAYLGDARIALANVRAAVDDVCADTALIAQHLPLFPLARALEAADVARALVHAEMAVLYAPAPPPTGVREVVKRVAKPRRNMVNMAITLAERAKLPAGEVARLGRRKGLPGMIDDVIIVTALFTTHAAAIAGMHPFTAADIEALRADGEWLRENVKPKGAHAPAKKREGTLEDDRDRLWTLLVQRYGLLERLGGYFHGAALADHVAPLRSRVRAPLADEDDGDPTPAPA